MKKWHIIAGVSALLVIVLVVAGSLVYKYYLVPKYLEPVVEEFSETMKSDDVLAEIYSVVSDFHDEGVISDDTYSTFMSAYNKRRMRITQAHQTAILSARDTLPTRSALNLFRPRTSRAREKRLRATARTGIRSAPSRRIYLTRERLLTVRMNPQKPRFRRIFNPRTTSFASI